MPASFHRSYERLELVSWPSSVDDDKVVQFASFRQALAFVRGLAGSPGAASEFRRALGGMPGNTVLGLTTHRHLHEQLARQLVSGRVQIARIEIPHQLGVAQEVEDLIEREPEPPPKTAHWIEFGVLDYATEPIEKVPFKLKKGEELIDDGKTPKDGTIRKDDIDPGYYTLVLGVLTRAVWEVVE